MIWNRWLPGLAGRQLAQLQWQIEHDALTGLANRASFRAAAAALIERGVPCAVAVIDIDRFRDVNETFGHMLGDALLVEIAAGLEAARSGDEIVARLGGDTFGVLIDGVANPLEAAARLEPFREVFGHPLRTGDRTGTEALVVGASVGVALTPHDAPTFADALAAADAAVEVAKSRERGSIAFHDPEFAGSVQRRRTLRLGLAGAIDGNQLQMIYQPTVALAGGTVAAVTGLVRWRHPKLGTVPAGEFVPVAENSTLIRGIGQWVFKRALDDLEALGTVPDGFACFLKVSAHDIRSPAFAAALRRHLAERPGLFRRLWIDVADRHGVLDTIETRERLAEVRELGVRVALSGFGSGCTSLADLSRFPIDAVKIDRSIVARLPGSEREQALVEVLLGIAQRFGYRTHADGIETAEQYTWLRERGCEFGAGFFIAPPMPRRDLPAWLAARATIPPRP